MPDLTKAQDALKKAETAIAELKAALTDKPAETSSQDSFDTLKAVLNTDKWPVCANRNLVCDPNNEAAKIQRGRGVVELMVEGDLTNKKFLDFGCGEGHSAAYAASKSVTLSVGYDITSRGWESRTAPNLKLTDKWEEVVANGPYDAILVFDVIDHLVSATAEEVLLKVKSVLADTGRVYLRVHPFMSRHANHTYHDLNKGWIHLVFTEDEMKTLLPDPKHIEPNTGGVKFPLVTYKRYFDHAGLEIADGKTRPVKDTIDPFFKTPAIAQRIAANVGMPNMPDFQMSIAFIDYVLKKPS